MQEFRKTRRLTGESLRRRLTTLEETILVGHKFATKNNNRWLLHVKAVGDALLEARWRLGRRSKWAKWRNALIHDFLDHGIRFSVRTAQQYAWIANKWDDPLVQELRSSGNVTSINAFVKVVQLGKSAQRRAALRTKCTQAHPQQMKLCALRQDAEKQFRKSIAGLKQATLSELNQHWYFIWPECVNAANRLAAFGWWRPNLALEHYLDDGDLPYEFGSDDDVEDSRDPEEQIMADIYKHLNRQCNGSQKNRTRMKRRRRRATCAEGV